MDLYLDQNHWIYRSRAYHGRSQRSDHAEIAKRLLAKVEQGEWRVPIAFSHLVEHYKEQNRSRRARLALTFEIFSRGWYLADWTDIVLQAALRGIDPTSTGAGVCALPS